MPTDTFDNWAGPLRDSKGHRPLAAGGFSPTIRNAHLHLLLLAVAFVLVLAPRPAAAGDKPMTVDAMLRTATPQDLALSPDGLRLAFSVSAYSGEADAQDMGSRLYLAEPAAGQAKPITPAREQAGTPRFSPDGAKLAYVRSDDERSEVVVLRLATGQARTVFRSRADVLRLEWSPDGRQLAVALSLPQTGEASGGDDAAVEVLGGTAGVSTGLFVLPAEGKGTPQPLVTDREVGEFVFSPDGTRIAFEASSPNAPIRGRCRATASGPPCSEDASQADIAVVDVRTRNVTLLAATPASENSPRFSPDGSRLAYVATEAPGVYFNAARVMVVPVSGGESRPLAATPDARPELLGWAAGGDALFVREASGTGAVLLTLPADGAPAKVFSDTPHVVTQAALAASGRTLAMVLEDSDLPAEVYASPTDRFAPRQLSDANTFLAAYRLPKTQVMRWTSRDGTPVEGLYTHPVTAGKTPPPLLVELHGGPAMVADRQCLAALDYYPLAVFAERGYAIFRPNVRGSDGYGPAFRMANRNDWGGGDFADLQSGLDALIERGLADPDRLGVMGWSYGGYLAAWAIGHTDRFKAASVGAGITDLISQSGSMDLPDFIPLYFGGEVSDRFDLLFDRSPLKYAAAITTPTLFQHGVDDDRVPFSQSLELFTALSRRGVPTRLAAYPRSGHDVTEAGLVRDLMTRNLDWFARYVPPSREPGEARLAAALRH